MRATSNRTTLLFVVWIASAATAVQAYSQEQDRADKQQPIAALAVIGFQRGELAERDAWIPIALEETLTRRLRNAPGLAVMPTARAHQARAGLREKKGDPPAEWARTLRLTGATRWLRGECFGNPRNLSIELELTSLAGGGETVSRGRVGPGRLMEVLDQATRWALENLGAATLDKDVERLIFASPAKSPSALEYSAKALERARDRDLQKAALHASDALGYDQSYRPALMLMAKLELTGGAATLARCATHLRYFRELAAAAGDAFDEAEFELAQGLLLLLTGSFEPALQRFEHALALARKLGDPFGETEALNQISEYWLSYRPSSANQLSEEDLANERKEDLRRAAEWQVQVLGLLARLGDTLSEVQAANKLALIYEQLDMPDDALTMHQRAVAAAAKTQSPRNEATALSFLGRFYRSQKRWQEALEATNKCLTLVSEDAAPTVRMSLGATYRGMSSPREALAQYESAYATLSQGTDLISQLACLKELADVQAELGDKQAAIARLTDALDIATALEVKDAEEIRGKIKKLGGNTP